MYVTALLLVLLVGGVLLAVRLLARPGRRGATGPGATALRAVFGEVLLYLAVVVSATGAAGLLGRALSGLLLDGPVAGGAVENARNSAFLVVGLPLVLGLGLRERRLLGADPTGRTSSGRAAYLAVTSFTALVVAMTAVHDSLVWAAGLQPENPRAVGRAVVWSLVWLAHRLLDRRLTTAAHAVPHLLAGSAVGLATTAVGVVGVVGNTGDLLLGLRLDPFTDPADQLRRAVVTLLVGGAVWGLYWWADARTARGPLAQGYALLAGPVAGTVTAVVGSAWGLSVVLLRLLGADRPPLRFGPHLLAVALVGLALRAYHGRLLGAGATAAGGRTDVHRLRDHAAAVAAVLTLGTGGVVAVVGVVGALTASVGLAGTAPRDLLLVALAVLATGLPVGWVAYRAEAVALAADGAAEHGSAVRRTYVLGTTGAGLLVGFGALVAAVFVGFEDLFAGTVGLATLRSMRFALGLLLVAGVVAATHARTARTERSLHGRGVRTARVVLLVGPADDALARGLARASGARVSLWPRTDAVEPAWPLEDVVAAVAGAAGPDVVVVRGPAGLLAVPVSRAGTPAVPAQPGAGQASDATRQAASAAK